MYGRSTDYLDMIASYRYWRNRYHTQSVCPGLACCATETERLRNTGQFTVNEWSHETALKMMSKETKQNLGAVGNGMLTLSCGVVAVCERTYLQAVKHADVKHSQGVAAAVISQPGDTLLSQINKGEGGPGSATSKLIRLAREAGFRGLFVGLGPRIIMVSSLWDEEEMVADVASLLLRRLASCLDNVSLLYIRQREAADEAVPRSRLV